MPSFSIDPLSPWGAEIKGVDLSHPLAQDDADALRNLSHEVDLIVATGQELTLEQQFAFMANFGPTLEYKDFNSVSTDPESGYLGATALPFHSDGAFSPFPLEAISLHAVDVVDGASSTRFASGVRTLERMPDTLRTALADRETLHVLPLHVDRRNRASDVPPAFPRAQHPAIVTDPQTGKEAVFMCEEMLDGIVGLTQQESDALVDAVFALHHAEDNVVEHRWHRGDLCHLEQLPRPTRAR